MNFDIRKYPRTPHLEGSRLQPGDEDLSQIPYGAIRGRHLVIEEKIDGANTAISFDDRGSLLLQSRGHYLRGGGREAHYDLFKQWAGAHSADFYEILGSRYIMFGEWMYAKHRVYYDALPAYFFEFDIFDREREVYLDTASRHAMTEGLPICSVPVLGEGVFDSPAAVLAHLGPSHYIRPGHIDRLREYCEANGLDAAAVLAGTDPSEQMEGLYIKIEEDGEVRERLKFVRPGFTQVATLTTQEWFHSKIIPNGLSIPFEALFE